MQKNATDRQKGVKGRMDTVTKSGKQPGDALKDELGRAESDQRKADQSLADKEKEKDEIRARYSAMRARYLELKGGGSAAPAPAPTPTAKK
jgi:hypothetical protein